MKSDMYELDTYEYMIIIGFIKINSYLHISLALLLQLHRLNMSIFRLISVEYLFWIVFRPIIEYIQLINLCQI